MIKAKETTDTTFHFSNFDLNRSEVENVTHNGTEYIKAPCVALNETILEYPGNRRYLIPSDELEKSAPGWNGEPIVAPTHPTVNGNPVTANHPDVLDQMLIGRSYNARYENGKLKYDLYFNKELLDEHPRGEEIQELIENGEVGELSTSYTVGELEEDKGRHEGQMFNGIQRDIKPDHTAILLDEKGNCSVEDGCGFPRTNSDIDQLAVNVRDRARTPTYQGTESSDWSTVSKTLTAVTNALQIDADRVEDMDDEDKSRIAELTLLGSGDADTWRDLYFFPVVNHNTMMLNENALDAVRGGRGAQADIPVDAEDSAEDMAAELLNQEFDRDIDMEDNVEANKHGMMNKWRISEAQNFLEMKGFPSDVEPDIDEEAMTFWFIDPSEAGEIDTDRTPDGMDPDDGVTILTSQDFSGDEPTIEIAGVKFYHGGQINNDSMEVNMDEKQAESLATRIANSVKNFFVGNQTQIGDWIAARRNEMDMSQTDLAADLPIAESTLSAIEQGDIETPSQPVLEALADAFDVEVSTVEGQLPGEAEPADMVAENTDFLTGSNSSKSSCDCGGNQMDREKLEEKIASNSQWSRDDLAEFSDDGLETLANKVEQAQEEAGDEDTEADASADSGSDSDKSGETVEVDKEQWDSVTSTVESLQETVAEQEEVIGNLKEQKDEKRESWKQTIVDNSETYDSEEELEGLSDNHLENMAKDLRPNYYGGQAGSAAQTASNAGDDATVPSPGVLTNKENEEE